MLKLIRCGKKEEATIETEAIDIPRIPKINPIAPILIIGAGYLLLKAFNISTVRYNEEISKIITVDIQKDGENI